VQRLKRLLGKGAETQQVVDNAITSLESLEANIQRLQAGVEVSKSKLAEIKVALNLAQTERDQKIIKSPVSGKILEVSTNIGSSLDTRQSFAQINPQGKTIAVCEIDELFADKVVVGQKAWIRNLGSQDTLSTGLVSFTSSFLKKKSLFTDQAGEKEDRRVREIKILIDQPEKLLINARVECVIELTAAIKN
jgi:multidrug resistance efflux pump